MGSFLIRIRPVVVTHAERKMRQQCEEEMVLKMPGWTAGLLVRAVWVLPLLKRVDVLSSGQPDLAIPLEAHGGLEVG